jgi:hypothetical protein
MFRVIARLKHADACARLSGAPPTTEERQLMSDVEQFGTYVILRRNGWGSPEELHAAAAKSGDVGDNEMSEDIRWIRSYVVAEPEGGLGTVCIYQASSPEKVREHASRAGIPADEVIPVADTVIVRPDPEAAAV